MICISITEIDKYLEKESFKINQTLFLNKDIDNSYDDEAICVKTENGVLCGYVGNSIDVVARGTHSAGYIYNCIEDNQKCKILFITNDCIIAEII